MHVTWFGLNSKLHLNVWPKATRVETSVNPHQEIFIPAQSFPVLIPMHVSIMRVGIFSGHILLLYSIPAALHFPWTPPIPVTCDVRHEPGARLATCSDSRAGNMRPDQWQLYNLFHVETMWTTHTRKQQQLLLKMIGARWIGHFDGK